MSKDVVSKVYNKDARKLNEVIDSPIVDVTITSPPYFDLKDYGYPEQIGFGQGYEEYLEDLKIVFGNVYQCTKDSGTLWVIIDTFRKVGEVTPLPFDFSNKIAEVGWKLQDIIIWQKDRTVPWTHKGQMRNLFEYILVFSKGPKYNFYIDEIRDHEVLKKWWVKYPERYNPKGKTPDGIWRYDIPTQGSWGNGYIKHFCPLPEAMIEQILKLTTKEGDIVLDPFAGSGAVLSKADFMNRSFLGFELNADYIKMFKNYLSKEGKTKKAEYVNGAKNNLEQQEFTRLNLDLRALKFARVLYSQLPKGTKEFVLKIYVEILDKIPSAKNKWSLVRYLVYCSNDIDCSTVDSEITKAISKPPLSKFGIEPQFTVVSEKAEFLEMIKARRLWTYTAKTTHKFTKEITKQQVLDASEIISSKIKVNLNEADYD